MTPKPAEGNAKGGGMNIRLLRHIIYGSMTILSLAFCLLWYGWKLAIVLFFLAWAHNLEKHWSNP